MHRLRRGRAPPVSYTHLDVYKRQHRHLICIGCAVAAHRLSLIHI
ncbi:hypothetical protein [Burkholderia plantarii]|nr:hypothetical protein [Burkholderia plantarii]